MPDTFTPHYNFTLPAIGGDTNTWGSLLNNNWSAIDTDLYTVSQAAAAAQATASAALPLTGGTLTGDLTLSLNTPFVAMKDTSQTLPAGVFRWICSANNMYLARNTAAAGDFSTQTLPFQIDGATDQMVLTQRPGWAGVVPWDSGNFNPANYAALASGPTFTGVLTALGIDAGVNGIVSLGPIVVPNNVGYQCDNNVGTPFSVLYVTTANVVTLGNNTVGLAFLASGVPTVNGSTMWANSNNPVNLAIPGHGNHANGLQFRWGSASVAANTTSTFSFDTPFPTAFLAVVGGPSGVPTGTATAYGVNASQVALSNLAGTAQQVSYLAIGY